MTFLLSVLFFVSGATALVYEVTWVRTLTLVFGGSHLAVTTVLTVFMGGLALGGALFGRRADRCEHPLRLYGLLELGVGALALVFLGLAASYRGLYAPLARIDEENPVWLTCLRVSLAAVAMIGPTTMMGGTLPVLVRVMSQQQQRLGTTLARLYAINTLGAVAGTGAAGFLLLQHLGAFTTQLVAIGASLAVGAAALAIPPRGDAAAPAPEPERNVTADPAAAAGDFAAPVHPILLAAGFAGFCALGYEVLWTRTLSLVVGTSVYSFTIILIAFLIGIAGGSQAFGWLHRRWQLRGRSAWTGFGIVHVAIGIAALAVTVLMRDLTLVAPRLQAGLAGSNSEFSARQLASLLVATGYMLPPALLLGAAFPMAGVLLDRHQDRTRGAGRAVGSVLAWNTLGAVFGAAVTGFALAPSLGYERSLHLLAATDVGVGMLVLAYALRSVAARRAIGATAGAVVLATALAPADLRLWDDRDLAIYMNNTRWAYDTEETTRATQAKFTVLYFREGANETISVLQRDDGLRTFVVNGRPEASTGLGDVQVQYCLGHLPALLHPHPRSAFVLGTGAGMTLGAVSAHPEIERIVLAEIEPNVLPATRRFADWNHDVLDDPRLHIVFNDGRNHLATTTATFDVITADPIHPWSGGAAYLYTSEYFRSVRARLAPGGVVSQWLPLYELTIDDVKCVARTFAAEFEHVAIFVTWSDAVLVASDSRLDLDEDRIAARMTNPVIKGDLERVGMRTARDVLSYFVLGDAGVAAYADGAAINTDDNLRLEFSAPHSMGVFRLLGDNIAELARCREPLSAYLPSDAGDEAAQRRARWARGVHEAGRIYDVAHTLGAGSQWTAEDYRRAIVALLARYPTYAPFRFLQTMQPF